MLGILKLLDCGDAIFNENEDSHAEFLKVYFSFGYYFGVIPYKFVLVEKDGKSHHTRHGHFINKVICAFVHVALFLHILGSFKEALYPIPAPGASETLTYYFSLTFQLCAIPYYMSFYFVFWTKSDAIAKLLDVLNSPPSHLETKCIIPSLGQINTRATLICSLFSFLSILSLIMRFKVVSPTWDIQELVGAYAGYAKYTFFVESTRRVLKPEELDVGNTVIAIIYVVIRFYSFVNGFFSDLLILMFALSYRSLTYKFFEYIDCKNRVSHHFVIQKYYYMKRTLMKINRIIGLTYSLGLLVTYPVNIIYFGNLTETEDDWFTIFHNMFFALHFVFVMVVSARAVENVGRLAIYLKMDENRINMSDIDFIVLADQLKNHPFGLQGKGLAVVTYKYIRKILSKFISYTLLLILFQYTRMMAEHCSACK